MQKLFLFIALLCTQFLQAQDVKAKGSLFIIGGGNRSDALMKQMVATAALRPNDYVVVLPMASEQPEVGFALIKQQIAKHSGVAIRNFDFRGRDSLNQKWIDSLSGARLIYILGGDQNRFMKSVLGNGIYLAIHKAYRDGATVAGTSAGAAVMSRYMITGQQLQDTAYRETFDKLWTDNIEFAEGLGLISDVIIDQHFIKRARYSRLISALAAKPQLVCLGIDESTAIIVHGGKATVAGESQVVRMARPKGAAVSGKLLKIKSVDLGIFSAGDVVRLKP